MPQKSQPKLNFEKKSDEYIFWVSNFWQISKSKTLNIVWNSCWSFFFAQAPPKNYQEKLD